MLLVVLIAGPVVLAVRQNGDRRSRNLDRRRLCRCLASCVTPSSPGSNRRRQPLDHRVSLAVRVSRNPRRAHGWSSGGYGGPLPATRCPRWRGSVAAFIGAVDYRDRVPTDDHRLPAGLVPAVGGTRISRRLHRPVSDWTHVDGSVHSATRSGLCESLDFVATAYAESAAPPTRRLPLAPRLG